MQIILLEKVVNVGNLGDVVKVKQGYARNFLIPQGKAKRATPEMVARMNAAVSKALDNPALRGRLDAIGLIAATPERRSPQYLHAFINAEVEKWAKPVQASGLKVD